MNITVVGIGYVGLANAILLAQHHSVIALDINPQIVASLNAGQSHLKDKEIETYLKTKPLKLIATTDKALAYARPDYVIIATPTDYNVANNYFDTSSIEAVLADLTDLVSCPIIIKSTIPMGYMANLKKQYPHLHLIFSPEFLREGSALHDNLYPTRIIIGDKSREAETIAQLFKEASLREDCPVLFMEAQEAEAVKLFSNTYLALRVAFFNELDSYAVLHGLDVQNIISGVGLDPRIGSHYNNPSFGYGGYCLPKDTKQLLANYQGVPNKLIQAIVESNETRKQFIANHIIQTMSGHTVGIYRLTMKSQSDNFRDAAIQSVIAYLKEAGKDIIIFEPTYKQDYFKGIPVYQNLTQFKAKSDIIVANRLDTGLDDVRDKVYTRDLFHNH